MVSPRPRASRRAQSGPSPAFAYADPAYLDNVEISPEQLRRNQSVDHFRRYTVDEMKTARGQAFKPKKDTFRCNAQANWWQSATKNDFRDTFQEGFANRQPAHGKRFEACRTQQWMNFFEKPDRKDFKTQSVYKDTVSDFGQKFQKDPADGQEKKQHEIDQAVSQRGIDPTVRPELVKQLEQMPKRKDGTDPPAFTNAWLTTKSSRAPQVSTELALARMMFGEGNVRKPGAGPHLLGDDRYRISTPCNRKKPWDDPLKSINQRYVRGGPHRNKDNNKPRCAFLM